MPAKENMRIVQEIEEKPKRTTQYYNIKHNSKIKKEES